MQRVMIIGCCGSGKSTLARALHEKTDLPLIYLDQHYWLPNWRESTKEVWEVKVRGLTAGEQWIIDGNYSGTMNIRLARADTIVYLDFPTWKCLYRVIKRIVKYHGRVRPDMPDGCKERFDVDFLHYVATFNIRKRKQLHRKLGEVEEDKQVIVLGSDRQIKEYLSR